MSQYEDHGIRFDYPEGWELDETQDSDRTTITLSEPEGSAFLFVTIDDPRHRADQIAGQALEAMRDEYPDLDAYPVSETLAGEVAAGHDVEFFSLDLMNACAIRAVRTPRRSLLVFGQWSETGAAIDYGRLFQAIRQSIRETDSTQAD